MSCEINEKCIRPDNVTVTLKKIFEFIRYNQISTSGYLRETTLYLKLSLTNFQSPLSVDPRESAVNTVTGIITLIEDNYVVLIAKRSCENIYDEYTVEYSKIIEVVNYYIIYNFNEFIAYLNKTPKLCPLKDNQYLDIIESLKLAVLKYVDDKSKDIKVIFNGVNSRAINNKDIVVERNVVILEKTFIIPITFIGGYIITPVCNNETIKEGASELDNKEKAGELNV